jgi:hypothetical protein
MGIKIKWKKNTRKCAEVEREEEGRRKKDDNAVGATRIKLLLFCLISVPDEHSLKGIHINQTNTFAAEFDSACSFRHFLHMVLTACKAAITLKRCGLTGNTMLTFNQIRIQTDPTRAWENKRMEASEWFTIAHT